MRHMVLTFPPTRSVPKGHRGQIHHLPQVPSQVGCSVVPSGEAKEWLQVEVSFPSKDIHFAQRETHFQKQSSKARPRGGKAHSQGESILDLIDPMKAAAVCQSIQDVVMGLRQRFWSAGSKGGDMSYERKVEAEQIGRRTCTWPRTNGSQ